MLLIVCDRTRRLALPDPKRAIVSTFRTVSTEMEQAQARLERDQDVNAYRFQQQERRRCLPPGLGPALPV